MSNGVLLHLRPTSVSILFTPGTPGFWIVGPLRREIIERAAIILQIEHAIALLEIEICSVQLTAMAQPAGKISLHQLRLPDLCLDVVERFGILRRLRREGLSDEKF